jgi:FlaG/FlaF family flagellin (archaellin)
MKMRKLRRNLAVSTIVANMMMIAITLSLAAILVAWAGTSFGTFSSGSQLFFAQRGQAMQERFVTENVYFNKTQNLIRIFVRNVGAEEVNIVAIYMNGTNLATASGSPCTIPKLLTVQEVCEFRISWSSWTTGAVYNFVVATARGNQVTYSARGP